MPSSKNVKSFFTGVVVFIAVASLLNLAFEVSMAISIVAASIAGITCALIVDALQKKK